MESNHCTFQKQNGEFCEIKKINNSVFCSKHTNHPKKSIIKNYDGSTIIEYRNSNNDLHRMNGPAYIEKNKNLTIHKWYKFGVNRNRLDPFMIEKRRNHQIGKFLIPLHVTKYFGNPNNVTHQLIECFNSIGLHHSFDFSIPSFEQICNFSPYKMWHDNGINCSIGYLKPCYIRHGSYISVENQKQIITELIEFLSMTNLIINYNQTENIIEYKWKKNGGFHRDEDKPSYIRIENDPTSPKYNELYYKFGKKHRLCGPASIRRIQNESTWYFYNTQVDKTFLTPTVTSILINHDLNSKFLCKCCFDMFSSNGLPLECGHWIHCFCYENKHFKYCLECNSEISKLHTQFLLLFCPLFVQNS